MYYFGHFSFERTDPEGEESHGYFTCLVRADDFDSALGKFRSHIEELRSSGEFFSGSVLIYVDDVIEAQDIPDKVIALNFREFCGEIPSSVTCSILSDDLDGCEICEWLPEDLDEDEDYDEAPFMVFEYTPPAKKKREGALWSSPGRHLRRVK
ncbi:MAG: hypothetical protein JW821_18270 [Deltaproteobacteria bacterium]|nr:hypothetical protein [Deltaproteobacteria bacterium]